MLFGIEWFTLIVVIRLVIQLFLDHMLRPWLRNCLQSLQGITSGSVRRIKPEVGFAEPFLPSPEKPLQAK
jgi:hypothetical protein